MLEGMGNKIFSGKCSLSQGAIDRLKLMKEELKEDISKADPAWMNIFGKEEQDTGTQVDENTEGSEDEVDEQSIEMLDHTRNYQSTQFHFTQTFETTHEKENTSSPLQKFDIVQSLYEGLERAKQLNLKYLENLSEEELLDAMQELQKKLSLTGVYNLCRSMNSMNLEQRTRYTPIFLSHLLLPKIITLDKPSRQLSSVITECVQTYPDDIQAFIFVPLLSMNLQDTTIISTIVNTADSSRKAILAKEFSTSVKELKSWHLLILQDLLSVKLDCDTNNRLIHLFLEKALDFSKDKTFGKLLTLFIKTNAVFREQQRDLLWEIVNTNETVFKKPLINILKKMSGP